MKRFILNFIFLLGMITISAQQLTLETSLNSALSETSGLLYLNNTLITHNDSEASNQLHEIDMTTGAISRTVTITNATNTDWEDLAHDDAYIYIGDFGNYRGDRTDLKVYRISKADYFANTSVTAEIINFTYANQTDFTPSPTATNFDAEGLIHFDNKLYIFSKNWLNGQTNIYEVPKTIGTHSISIIDTINSQGLISGATFNNLDNSIMLCGYDFNGAFLTQLSGFHSGLFSNGTIVKTSVEVPTNYSTQIEGVIPINTTDYFVSAEESGSTSQALYRFDTSTLTIENYDDTSISIYPNPAQNNLRINKENCWTKIYTLTGQLVKTSSESEIDISELSKGVYLVEIQNPQNNRSNTKRLIVE
ncbi:T9SS type A sorting domain-containing protein [Winogradskyella forsetii]|uniref:T9SS type A sorting domain-containing protein n=1 Tax=Winogradskyella forsetii TaxID=2686077 RepID=UPI0015B92D2C|nr:T9SS type A sorting domain-containing protein [Winogradskyella forsetii]